VDIFPIPSGGRADSARADAALEQRSWIPAMALATEFGVARRTISRWLCDEALGFPRPRVVNKRLYFQRSDIDAWKASAAIKMAGGVDG
jgi:predicted DNA-binding transcriptional regulator AlpA